MIFYNYGLSEEAYGYLKKIYLDPRRMYPEASSGAMEGIVRGMMGIEPSASENLISTCPRFYTKNQRVNIQNVPVFSGLISVNHHSAQKTTISCISSKSFTWRATFRGNYKLIRVNGKIINAKYFYDSLHHIHSYADIPITGYNDVTAEAI